MYRLLFLILLLSGCTSYQMPDSFRYKTIDAQGFDISVWEKQAYPRNIYHVYIEGDGHAFNAHGQPTSDPTPKSSFLRQLATQDRNTGVVYIARPCQFTKGLRCQQKYWTTARFSSEVVEAEYQAIKEIVGNKPIILIGYSGGAQIAGLIAIKKDLYVQKVITIAGNLDHKAWTDYHHLPELTESLNLADYKDKFTHIPQIHYVGEKDKVIPPILTKEFVKDKSAIHVVPNATHGDGWNEIDLR